MRRSPPLRRLFAAAVLVVLPLGACLPLALRSPAPPVSQGPTTTPRPTRAWNVFYARELRSPVLVSAVGPDFGDAVADRVRARLIALEGASKDGPDGSFNAVVGATARLKSVTVSDGLARLDYEAPNGEWGLDGAKAIGAFVQQIVYTATDETSIAKVFITENGGMEAIIGGEGLIIDRPQTRETVAQDDRRDHAIVYFARDRQRPIAVAMPGAGLGLTAEERIASRLLALASPPSMPAIAGAFNVVPESRAQLANVSIIGDLVTIDYAVPDDDWGISGSTNLKAFVQQLVFTATEEPGITRALITQNGGQQAVIGGEGLVLDGPRARDAVAVY